MVHGVGTACSTTWVFKILSLVALLAGQPTVRADPSAGITPTVPDIPARRTPPAVPPANFRPVDDLDGYYVWLGPSGGAGYLDSKWDSLIGADATVMRVQEHEALGAIGGTLSASR